LFSDQDQAVGEIARVVKMRGDFVCQTTFWPGRPPLLVRVADRLLKFGYFYLDDLRDRLARFNFDLEAEEQSKITYIFRAAKARIGPIPQKAEPVAGQASWLRAAPSPDQRPVARLPAELCLVIAAFVVGFRRRHRRCDGLTGRGPIIRVRIDQSFARPVDPSSWSAR
jgi:hypothetical protein